MDAEKAVTLEQGLVAGLIGYATVALFYLGVDLGTGAPLADTAARLGRALLGESRVGEPGAVLGPALAFNGLHLLVSLLAGMAAAWLFREVDLHPRLYYAGLTALVAGVVSITVLLAVLGAQVAGAVSWASVAAAVLLAAAAMGLYLWTAHPELERGLTILED